MILPRYDEHGNLLHNGEKYTAIKRLSEELTILGVAHDMKELFDGYQITVPAGSQRGEWEGDAIQHFGSYGAEEDLIEVYGFGLEEPVGHLTVKEALEFFAEWNRKRAYTKAKADFEEFICEIVNEVYEHRWLLLGCLACFAIGYALVRLLF